LRDLYGAAHDASTAASRRLLDMAKARVAARAGVIDILADDPQPLVAEGATMAEVSAGSNCSGLPIRRVNQQLRTCMPVRLNVKQQQYRSNVTPERNLME